MNTALKPLRERVVALAGAPHPQGKLLEIEERFHGRVCDDRNFRGAGIDFFEPKVRNRAMRLGEPCAIDHILKLVAVAGWDIEAEDVHEVLVLCAVGGIDGRRWSRLSRPASTLAMRRAPVPQADAHE